MKEKISQELTRAEEEVMQVLWDLKKGFVKELLVHFKDPKPAYNTVSTIIRILEEKGFVAHNSFGKSHEYYPLYTKDEYSRYILKGLAKGYFNNSFKSLVSFMLEEKDISLKEIDELKKLIKKKKHD